MANLENVSAEDLRQILAEVKTPDAAKRVMAAITYKEDDALTQTEAAQRYGFTSGWASKWFRRLERLETEPFENVVYDDPRSGRPSELSENEHEHFVEALHNSPEEVGVDARAWTVPLARQYLSNEFDVEYCPRHVRRLMTEAGLSWKTARPGYTESDDRPQDAFEDGFEKRRTVWTTSTRS